MAPTSVKDINGHVYIKALSQFLKKTGKVKQPEWSDIVKLTSANELAPYDPDWFYVRCAAILRHLYIRQTGMLGLRRIFSRKQRNGVKPSHRALAHSSVIRKALQQMEALGLCTKVESGGRALTSAGRRDLDRVAYQLVK
ncbi:Ribosomal protein S19a isoform C [Fasciola hepatica]|uniref:Small ribosomal subunit protein eS19 n=1 Tax=Fasciola hepatica TaxID=6192 RepID=A0A2H1CUU9_FASHE|nr:Ribosomal protein S19a isoform C [Fasciola hepatica]